MTVAGWLIGWPTLAGDSFNPWVRSCWPDVVGAVAIPALGADIPGWGLHVLATQGSWLSQMGWRNQGGLLLRQSWKGWPQMLASLPQVCGGQGRGIDGLSAEGKGNRKKKKPLVTAAVTLVMYKPRPGITDF